MLDKVTYTDNGDGTFNKQIVSNVTLTKVQIADELAALQAQANNFAIGRSSDPKVQADIDATIANTNNALTLLQTANAQVTLS